MIDVHNIEEYQLLLNQLPGVHNSRIIADDEGNLAEIHILSDISRSPKQIVRDVQSALLVSSNLQVDHKIISVAQIEGNYSDTQEFRLCIDSIQMYSRHTTVEARVLLKRDDQIFEGTSTGGNSPQVRMRIVAEATLKAVRQFCKKEFLFVLSDVLPINLNNQKAITVSVLYFTEKGEVYLIGSSFVNNDESEAVVKATLDAINRKLIINYNE